MPEWVVWLAVGIVGIPSLAALVWSLWDESKIDLEIWSQRPGERYQTESEKRAEND